MYHPILYLILAESSLMADLLTSDKLILRGEENEIYHAYMRYKGTTLRVVPSAYLSKSSS